MKIQLFEHGTLFINKNTHYRLEIPENQVLAERDTDLKDLKEDSPYFFDLKEAKKEGDRVALEYEVEDEYQPLLKSKNYSRVLRLALLNELLEIDPLNRFEHKVLIHPRNIFFKDLKTIKFLYRSNQWLPYENHLEPLYQYKILTLSMFSRFSYEKYKREKEKLLNKEKDEFFFIVENTESVEDLKGFIAKTLHKEETEHFFNVEKEKQKAKKQKRIWIGACVGVCAIVFASSLVLQQTAASKVSTAYAEELKKAEQETQFYKLLSEDNFTEAIKYLKENGGTDKQIAKLYFDKGEYQEAIDMDKSLIKPSVEALYKDNKQDKILELKSESNYLELEKKIVSYDHGVLLSSASFVKDKDQLLRIGKAFAEHGNIPDAQEVNKKLNNPVLKAMIKKKEIDSKIAVLQQQITDLNEAKNISPEEKQKQLDLKNKEQEELKKELEKVNEELG